MKLSKHNILNNSYKSNIKNWDSVVTRKPIIWVNKIELEPAIISHKYQTWEMAGNVGSYYPLTKPTRIKYEGS